MFGQSPDQTGGNVDVADKAKADPAKQVNKTERQRLQDSLRQTLTDYKQSTDAKKNGGNQQASQGAQGKASESRKIGNYIIGKSLGQGTFGKVRLGTHAPTGEQVAVKILEKDRIKDEQEAMRIMREINILKIVRHPNIVQLYEIIETSRQLFLIMEYAPCGELFDYIVKKKRLQDKEAARFFKQIVAGVEYLHRNKICHRDLKPENLLLDENMNVKIVDFGLSNTYKNASDTLKTACGSPCYAPPEMILGKRYSGLSTDIWTLGVILYAMTVGYLPFEDKDTNKLYKKILSCDYLTPGFLSANAKDLIKKIIQVEADKRASIEEIKRHAWCSQIQQTPLEGIVVSEDKIPILDQIIKETKSLQGTEKFGDLLTLETQVTGNRHNQLTATYYLIIKKYERGTDQDMVFGKFQRDKRIVEQQRFSRSSSSNQNAISTFGSQALVNTVLQSKSGTVNAAKRGGNSSSIGSMPNQTPQQASYESTNNYYEANPNSEKHINLRSKLKSEQKFRSQTSTGNNQIGSGSGAPSGPELRNSEVTGGIVNQSQEQLNNRGKSQAVQAQNRLINTPANDSGAAQEKKVNLNQIVQRQHNGVSSSQQKKRDLGQQPDAGNGARALMTMFKKNQEGVNTSVNLNSSSFNNSKVKGLNQGPQVIIPATQQKQRTNTLPPGMNQTVYGAMQGARGGNSRQENYTEHPDFEREEATFYKSNQRVNQSIDNQAEGMINDLQMNQQQTEPQPQSALKFTQHNRSPSEEAGTNKKFYLQHQGGQPQGQYMSQPQANGGMVQKINVQSAMEEQNQSMVSQNLLNATTGFQNTSMTGGINTQDQSQSFQQPRGSNINFNKKQVNQQSVAEKNAIFLTTASGQQFQAASGANPRQRQLKSTQQQNLNKIGQKTGNKFYTKKQTSSIPYEQAAQLKFRTGNHGKLDNSSLLLEQNVVVADTAEQRAHSNGNSYQLNPTYQQQNNTQKRGVSVGMLNQAGTTMYAKSKKKGEFMSDLFAYGTQKQRVPTRGESGPRSGSNNAFMAINKQPRGINTQTKRELNTAGNGSILEQSFPLPAQQQNTSFQHHQSQPQNGIPLQIKNNFVSNSHGNTLNYGINQLPRASNDNIDMIRGTGMSPQQTVKVKTSHLSNNIDRHKLNNNAANIYETTGQRRINFHGQGQNNIPGAQKTSSGFMQARKTSQKVNGFRDEYNTAQIPNHEEMGPYQSVQTTGYPTNANATRSYFARGQNLPSQVVQNIPQKRQPTANGGKNRLAIKQ